MHSVCPDMPQIHIANTVVFRKNTRTKASIDDIMEQFDLTRSIIALFMKSAPWKLDGLIFGFVLQQC